MRPDELVRNMESKIDSLTDQIANLTLMMKKSSPADGEEKRRTGYKDCDYDIVCS